MTVSPHAALAGFALGASLIIAIGAQNAFVLRQGLKREYVLEVATVCFVVDATLISLGVAGFGAIVSRYPQVLAIAAWGGAAFLAVHGALSLRSAMRPAVLHAEEARPATGRSRAAVLATVLAVSLLNPHVYLDTVVLLGSVAAQYPAGERASFAVGAMTASALWFYGLAFGARILAPLFERPVAWRILDLAITFIMWSIALSLVIGQLR